MPGIGFVGSGAFACDLLAPAAGCFGFGAGLEGGVLGGACTEASA
jgi:hypothetical protein